MKNMAVILQGKVSRYAQSFVMEMPKGFPGDSVHCFMSFASANGKLQGNSWYVGELVVV